MYREQQFKQLLNNRRILIAGYGREGKSSYALLQRLLPEGVVDVAQNDEEIFSALERAVADNCPYDWIIKSPGISTMKFEGRCNLATITSQTDLFLQVYGDRTIAVSGTKGKSTTTTLIHHVLKEHFGDDKVVLAGNMGIPLFDILDQIAADSWVVAEFSCHQLENIHRGPHIGILLNLYQEHLDHYHDYRGYQMAKMQMALCQTPDDYFFYCNDSADLLARVEEVSAQLRSRVTAYSLAEAKQSCVASMPSTLKGDHNVGNVFVAYKAASLLGVDEAAFAKSLMTFQGLPHRLEKVGTYQDILFYNDSISTIPEAAIAAVEALEDVDTLILGGFDRKIDYTPLGAYLVDKRRKGFAVRNIVFVGDAGRRMKQEWQLQGRSVLVEDDYAKIVAWCYDHTAKGKVCLLSPAAASYDAFKNFEERGSKYKELIVTMCDKNDCKSVREIRQDLHAHPGVSGDEYYAHDTVVRFLAHCHPDKVYEHVGGFGVIAVWGTNKSHPMVAVRGDIDALPIGHRCGHDGHTAILLCLAEMIAAKKVTNVILVFQPEEETGMGSQKILDAGILQQYNIKQFFGLHNLPGFALGTVVLNRHTFAAASSGVIYHLQGRNTHASTPEKGLNPGLAVAEIIERMMRLNSGEKVSLDNFRQSTLICVRLGEEAFGTSAGEAEVMFTLRAFTNNAMEHLLTEANAIVSEVAAKHHLQSSATLREPFRATENDSALVEYIEEVCGCRSQYTLTPFRWSEDFANYLQEFRGAMFGIGAGEKHCELHHPDYDFPDELIEPAAKVLMNLIVNSE